jgi:nucleoside-diphosphate-sugar epimerase
VIATSRHPAELPEDPSTHGVFLEASAPVLELGFVPKGARVLYSIPTIEGDEDASRRVLLALQAFEPRRVVYLSTTGVYGHQAVIDEKSQPAPRTLRDEARISAENAALASAESAIVLRPAAIYGPGRGIHVSMREGRFRMGGAGSNYVSRIHVEDLATHCEAALFSDLSGAWPVADEYPCTTMEVAEFCAERYGYAMPPSVHPAALHHTRQANRRVDGSAIRRLLGITLAYPSFREGIPASMT